MSSGRGVLWRSLTCVSFLALSACTSDAPDVNLPATGIPIELARQRAATIRDVRYALSFEIPSEVGGPIAGRVTAHFVLDDTSAPLVFDYAPAHGRPVDSLTLNGANARFDPINGHIVIAPDDLVSGENTAEIAFRAGDGALHRNPEFLYTLFVPALAHTVFPVFDQPDLKARYTLELTLPEDWVAVANGAEVSRDLLPGRVRIRYGETEPIPTYLFGFAAGEFEIEEAERDGRAFRMFHRETDTAKVERNRERVFDLHAAALDQLEDYTGIPYPFGKFDFVLIPAFEFGGMEHPGAIYYRDSGILLEESATEDQRLDRASLISHETSHMWFGDLVTMRWFDDVWMKEVFANFMAGKIVNPSFPEVNHDLLFLTGNYPAAYGVDRTAGTHPIRQELANLDEAGSLYGAIIYQKAPIVMRQLERTLGEDAFRDGVREYLDDFRFGNATWLDLIERLDARTEADLAAWSRAWVEEPGRPVVDTQLATDAEGRIESLALVQSDPVEGRGLEWTQQIEVLVGSDGEIVSIPVELAAARTEVAAAVSLRADFVLPNGGGLAYGDLVLDPMTRSYLLEHLTGFEDALVRGAVWVALWEEMLGGRVSPAAMMELALSALAVEDTEQIAQLVLNGVRGLFWRYSSPAERDRVAARLEGTLREGIDRSDSSSKKAAFFSAFYSVMTTDDGVEFLESVWSRERSIPGLTLSERDETAMAEHLALRDHPRAVEILETQMERISNADRRSRFRFVMPSLSRDPAGRSSFFESLAEVSNRTREPWVLDGLAYLGHPLRAPGAGAYIRPGLEMLVEIRDTGDIFFPRNWAGVLLGGQNTPAAADTVRGFLAEQTPDYPVRLRQIVLQAADPLFRAAGILEAAEN